MTFRLEFQVSQSLLRIPVPVFFAFKSAGFRVLSSGLSAVGKVTLAVGFYFEDSSSMFAQTAAAVEPALRAIVRRYLAQNPPHPFTYRAYRTSGIVRGADYRYQANFNEPFPEARIGTFVYIWSKLWSDSASTILFDVNVHCPMELYRNQQCLYRSSIFEERYPDKRHRLAIDLEPGWNHFVLRFRKTRAGFGGIFGTWLGKLPYYFLFPNPERDGQEGWLFSEPLKTPLSAIPDASTAVDESGVKWHPRVEWPARLLALGQCERMFGRVENACAVGWTRAGFARPGRSAYTFSGQAHSPIRVIIDDQEMFAMAEAGAFSREVEVAFGVRDVMVRSDCGGSGWGFELKILDGDDEVALVSPCNIAGSNQPWMYAGPLAPDRIPAWPAMRDLDALVDSLEGETYWRLDAPDGWVRPYNENPLYGKWNYPLGVTLYGLLHAARVLGSKETEAYVVSHFQYCCDTYRYAMWDRRQYGGATNVHHLLTSLDSLDDCGSCGSALLEVARETDLRDYRTIADVVADYITNDQARLGDGTFFRKELMHEFHNQTMWADDLYMSVPFLCRYYQLTGEQRFVDDAARQFLGFKKRLYIPELRLMSHIYDFSRDLATGIPWGRGNGWVVFSLSELLEVLPPGHGLRPELLQMFRELSDGILAQQDEAGMWHQVLNEHDAYPETSCTSMFAYAFARGVRFGWYEDPVPFHRAALRGWEALTRISIDATGNVHGVCRGSEFSFQSEYYKRDLLWNLNDTHGVGIVLLAGIEILRLNNFLNN